MTNILYVTSSLAHDGTQTFIMNVYRNLDFNKVHADFLLTNGIETDYSKEVERNGSIIYVVPSRKKNPIKYYSSLISFFSKNKSSYHSIHFCYGSLTSIAVIILAYLYKIPVRILHAHSSSVVGLHNKILHRLNRNIANWLTNYHYACSENAGHFFFNSSFTIIRNGINVDLFSFNNIIRTKVREDLSIPGDYIVWGHVGRFVELKNHKFILDVFCEYLQVNTKAHLLLIGDGELSDIIKEKAKKLCIDDKVSFLGQRLDVSDLMQAMDCFIMPSVFEGLPFVLVEAQAAGLPCFVSDTIDNGSKITDNVHFLSLNKKPQEWARYISFTMNNYERKKQDEIIKGKGFDIIHTAQKLESIYMS